MYRSRTSKGIERNKTYTMVLCKEHVLDDKSMQLIPGLKIQGQCVCCCKQLKTKLYFANIIPGDSMVTPSNVVMLSYQTASVVRDSLKLLRATLHDTCDITGTSLGTQNVKGVRKERDGSR